MDKVVKYIGDGSFVLSLPKRDLTQKEVDFHGGIETVLATGLYELIEKNSTGKSERPIVSNKSERPASNK